MNIKLKAFLITLAVIFGLFGSIYVMIYYPWVFFIAFLCVTIYAMYNLVLNLLQSKEMRGPR